MRQETLKLKHRDSKIDAVASYCTAIFSYLRSAQAALVGAEVMVTVRRRQTVLGENAYLLFLTLATGKTFRVPLIASAPHCEKLFFIKL